MNDAIRRILDDVDRAANPVEVRVSPVIAGEIRKHSGDSDRIEPAVAQIDGHLIVLVDDSLDPLRYNIVTQR